MVSHQDKVLGVEQRTQTYRLTDLRCLIHNAEVKASTAEYWVLYTHTGGGHNQLQRKRGKLYKQFGFFKCRAINQSLNIITYMSYSLQFKSLGSERNQNFYDQK